MAPLMLDILARQALDTGEVRKLRDSTEVPRVELDAEAVGPADAETDQAARAIADRVWQAKGDRHFDGQLLGARAADWSGGALCIQGIPIRYRDYLAADEILRASPAATPPLAIGVHAVLECEEELICLKLKNGTIGLPGGAVDWVDAVEGGESALAYALVRELEEETGIGIGRDLLRPEGIYVGGTPTHLICLFSAPVDAPQVAEAVAGRHVAADKDIVGTALFGVADLLASPGEKSLALRLALERISSKCPAQANGAS